MYSVSDCDQTVGQDMIQAINTLYSVPSLPDLVFENVSARMSGRLLNINLTVLNAGLSYAGNSTVTIYADGSVVREVNLGSLSAGYGRIVIMKNIFISQISVKELELVINDNFYEISKDNNKIKLEIK
jgi:subtilase family serine protease